MGPASGRPWLARFVHVARTALARLICLFLWAAAAGGQECDVSSWSGESRMEGVRRFWFWAAGRIGGLERSIAGERPGLF